MPRVNDTRYLPRKYTTQAEQYRIPLPHLESDFRIAPSRIYPEVLQQPAQQDPRAQQEPILPVRTLEVTGILHAEASGQPPTKKPDQRFVDKFCLQWSEDFQPGNCGMRVISTVGGFLQHFFETSSGWQDFTSIAFRVSDLWKELDKKFVLKEKLVGQVLITDLISRYGSKNTTPKPDDMLMHFNACHLVQYILARKLGTVFRGPVTRNPRYKDHIIVSWIWIPNPEWLVKSDPKVFNEPKEYSEQTAALAKETEALTVLDHEQWINDNVTWSPEST